MKPTMTRLSVAVLVSSTVLSTIGPMQSYAATYEGTVNTSILNVRSSTSTTSTIVGKLTQGTTVHVYSTSNNWAEIDFQGQKRYVSSSYLTLKPTVAKTSTTQTYTANANVNMRSAMTTTAPIVTTIPKGATVTYMSTHGATGSWFKVTYGGKTGYVAQRYFTLSGGGTVTPQANATHTTVNNTSMH
ncbi:MAG: SH3 domain-containing protein, partial [Exiguobacterium sp.]|nr:SH3 domain-containing protein [Exiguobacterium sp.]MDX5424423.1 SH3 domain-containing protein [Exiguobacterium sp.]MDX6771927.1 SH3 domain-containing protein [Exiguobacterium sp.]